MIEILMGMEIKDSLNYQKYREGMTPILESYGGRFGYDFTIDKTLLSETDKVINRVFTIVFPSDNASKEFFTNAEYSRIKSLYFEQSVGDITCISKHDKVMV